jgi:glycerol uptake facilitator-like aquaporin
VNNQGENDLSNSSTGITKTPWYRGPAFILLAVLLSVYAVSAFIGSDGIGAHLVSALLWVSLLLGVRKITQSTKALKVTFGIVIVGVAGQVLIQRLAERPAYLWQSWVSLVFFSAVLVFLVWAVFKAKRVDADTVFAASAVYLLLGIVCAYAFMLVYLVDPGAFSLNEADLADPGPALLHYSFTTLTTVGYGSISPMSGMARTISDLEAVIAQLYLAVILARLVSLEIEHSRKSNGRES